MAYLAELDTRLLLYIQDALRYEPLHSFWRGISFLGDLGWFWIFTGILLALNSKTRTAGITAIAALVLSTFISNVILKNAVMRPRPFDVLPQIIPLISFRAHHRRLCLRLCVLQTAAKIFRPAHYAAGRNGCFFAPVPRRALPA